MKRPADPAPPTEAPDLRMDAARFDRMLGRALKVPRVPEEKPARRKPRRRR